MSKPPSPFSILIAEADNQSQECDFPMHFKECFFTLADHRDLIANESVAKQELLKNLTA